MLDTMNLHNISMAITSEFVINIVINRILVFLLIFNHLTGRHAALQQATVHCLESHGSLESFP